MHYLKSNSHNPREEVDPVCAYEQRLNWRLRERELHCPRPPVRDGRAGLPVRPA